MTNNNTYFEINKEKKFKHLTKVDRGIISHILKEHNIKDLTKYIIKPSTKNRKYFISVLNKISISLNKSIKTIKREITRGTIKQLDIFYRPILIYAFNISHDKYRERITKKELPLKIDNNTKLPFEIARLLNNKFSPYAIIQILKSKYNINFSIQTLYNYIHKDLFKFVGYKKVDNTIIYKSKGNRTYNKRVIKSGGLSIDDREDLVNFREILGHWEIDTVVGIREGKSKVILTLTERVSRLNIVTLLDAKTNDNVIKEVKKIIKSNKYLIHSITSDNGVEFSNVKDINDLGVKWYFAHPYCSNQRGSNENNNKFIRRFINKGKSMNNLKKKDVKFIENFMNNYPRKIFNSSTSLQVYECLLNLI